MVSIRKLLWLGGLIAAVGGVTGYRLARHADEQKAYEFALENKLTDIRVLIGAAEAIREDHDPEALQLLETQILLEMAFLPEFVEHSGISTADRARVLSTVCLAKRYIEEYGIIPDGSDFVVHDMARKTLMSFQEKRVKGGNQGGSGQPKNRE